MFRKAIVVMCHPEDHSVDLVMCDDGARLSGVPVLSPNASARSGSVDMPEMPDKTGEAKWDITQRHGQDMEAMVAMMGAGNPVVVGFMYSQVSQMTFKDKKRRFDRHQSDVYSTVDGDGNMEIYHPSGAYVRIAEKTEHEDLEKKNFDENLTLDRNKDRKVSIHISSKDNLAYITISPDGNITITAKKKINISAEESVNISSLAINISGKVSISGDGVTHNGKNIGDSHVHEKVMPGVGLSGPPAN